MFVEPGEAASQESSRPRQSRLSHPSYRPDIDGLRAIAVLSVVAFHAFPSWMPGGFIGVDIFFVISGYLISTIILGSLAGEGFSYGEFYARRIRRILPALLVVMAATFVVGWYVLLADEFGQLGKHLLASAGFVVNLVLWGEAGYFDAAAGTKPLLHLWSLAVEEQFYIIWPVLLGLAWRFGGGKGLLAWLWVVTILSFLLNVMGVHSHAAATFYSPLTRMWELAAGALLAWAVLRGSHGNVFLRVPRSVLGLVLIGLGLVLISEGKSFPGFWALLPVVGACLCISAGPGAWPNRYLLGSRPMIWVGLISYPLYLWHWPLQSFARIVESGTPSPWTRGLLLLAAVALAWVTYEVVESRFQTPGRTPVKVGALLVSMVVIGGVGWATYANEGLKFRSHIRQTNAVNAQLTFSNWTYIKNDRCLKKYPLQGTDAYEIWFCMASSDKNPTLLLLGDSHANHLYPGFINNPEFQQQSVLNIGNCDPGWVEKSELSPKVTRYTCSGYRILDQMELINGIVSTSHSVRYVIMAGAGLNQKSSPWYIAKLRRRINFLESHGVKVILFAPHVWVTYNPRGCFGRPFATPKESCELPVEAYREKLSEFNRTAQAIMATNPSVRVFDQNVLFCNEERCSFKKDGMPLLRDEFGHLSEYGSNQVVALFAEWARTNAPDLLANDRVASLTPRSSWRRRFGRESVLSPFSFGFRSPS